MQALAARALVVVVACSGGVAAAFAATRLGEDDHPQVVLWAWQRPEDLRFLAGTRAAAAPLVGTIRLVGAEMVVAPRSNPLRLARGVAVLPVVRLEAERGSRPTLDVRKSRAVARAIARLARGRAVQVDFDAAVSQRTFLRRVIADLRLALPVPSFISVTALASSCLDGSAAGLGADEVVPMLFRLGPEAEPVRRRVVRGELPPCCRRAVGVALDEPIVRAPGARRVYVFAPRAWDGDLFARAAHEVRR